MTNHHDDLQQYLIGLTSLARFERGAATFVVGQDGALAHVATVVTVRMETGESIEAFHARFRRMYHLQPGDEIELLNNGGRCDTVRLTIHARD